MVEIKFKIFSSFIQEEDDFKGEYGYFLLRICDKFYGEYRKDIDLDILAMNIYDWFNNFMRSLILLKDDKKVYISDVETAEVWIRIISKNADSIQISELHADKIEGSHSLEVDIDLNEKDIVWQKTIRFKDFQEELIKKGKQYLLELKKLNNEKNKYVQYLEKLLKEISF